MGRTITFTELECEFLDQMVREHLTNLSMYNPLQQSIQPTRFEDTQDNLGANILARLAAAASVQVDDPGPPAVIFPGDPAPNGDEPKSQIVPNQPPRYY